jgi:hypothetical protein
MAPLEFAGLGHLLASHQFHKHQGHHDPRKMRMNFVILHKSLFPLLELNNQ